MNTHTPGRTASTIFMAIFRKSVSILLGGLIVSSGHSVYAQSFAKNTTDSTRQHDQKMKWWRQARFGMFIHWGVYAQLAGTYQGHSQAKGGAEWIMNRMKIPVRSYQAFAKKFNPTKFNADDWVRIAKEAGMKYIIITAKHHDGFAMFSTEASPWNIVDATPYGKDILKELATACEKYHIRLGFYYSQAQDWNNPGGSAARKLTREGWPNPDSAHIDAYTLAHHGHWDSLQTTASFDDYIDRVAVPQVKELLSNYGKIAVLWWDTPTNMTRAAAEKLQDLLKLQPGIITNDRLKRPDFPGDTKTPEQKIPNISDLDGKDWETCMTMNGTWGYRATDQHWKPDTTLIRNLCGIASKGGNYLLNVGPKPDGTFPQASIDRLRRMGEWMKINSQGIYGSQPSPLPPLNWGCCTRKKSGPDKTVLYLFVFNWPKNKILTVPGLKNKILSASLLDGGAHIQTEKTNTGVTLSLPDLAPDPIASVIKIEVEGEMTTYLPDRKSDMKSGALD